MARSPLTTGQFGSASHDTRALAVNSVCRLSMRDCPSRGAPDDGFLFWPSTGLLGDDQRCKRDKLFLARPVPHRPVIILKPEPHRTVMASCLSATACRVCCIVQGSGHHVRFLWFIHDIVPPSALHQPWPTASGAIRPDPQPCPPPAAVWAEKCMHKSHQPTRPEPALPTRQSSSQC